MLHWLVSRPGDSRGKSRINKGPEKFERLLIRPIKGAVCDAGGEAGVLTSRNWSALRRGGLTSPCCW